VEAELSVSLLEMDAITVTGGYFSDVEDQPTSAVSFSFEEIRRAPGSAGDVSRIISGLPSLAKVNDQSNSLIVRGGSPAENAFFIDNIEIPNINHFPTQGTSGGPIGMVNVDFIRDVTFFTGGFTALYGDKLSSVMNISFREGNRSEFDGQLDLNFAGFGGVFEAPLLGRKGSWLLSVRRSYLDLLVDQVDVGTDVAPRYGDIQGKLVFDIDPTHRLTLLGLFGDDHNSPDREAALENAMVHYGNQDIYEGTGGVNWRALWGGRGYSNTSVAYTSTKFTENFRETNSDLPLLRNRSHEQIFKFRNVNHFRLSERSTIEFGAEVKHIVTEYDNFYAEYTNALGDTIPEFRLDERSTANKAAGFVSYIVRPLIRLTTTLGLRADYFTLSENLHLSPRISFSYRLTDRTSLNGSSGLFYQSLPLILLNQNPGNRDLRDPMSVHYILGVEHLISEDTKITVEAYRKDYDHFPLDPAQPGLFVLDELFYQFGFFYSHSDLNDLGKARSHGVEMTVQKKLARDIYGMASIAYSRSRYRGGDGVWRDRVFDNRFVFGVEAGYKPSSLWEFSLRWIYAGGPPYTPFDIQRSEELDRAVLDENRINEARYPDYHSLNLRFDKRFHFSGSNLVLYVSVWNAYDRKNVASYYWNGEENRQDTIYQWGILPIFGLEFEF
jgi:outer membrane receptor for ferrienterochelin and colicin